MGQNALWLAQVQWLVRYLTFSPGLYLTTHRYLSTPFLTVSVLLRPPLEAEAGNEAIILENVLP